MARGRRCDLGCQSWPVTKEFNPCPVCGEPTETFSNLQPLPLREAQQLKREIEFEEFYAGHCARQKQSVDGPLPEVV